MLYTVGVKVLEPQKTFGTTVFQEFWWNIVGALSFLSFEMFNGI